VQHTLPNPKPFRNAGVLRGEARIGMTLVHDIVPRWLGRFWCSEFGKEGRVVIFQRKVARPRSEVVRTGWNDAAWGRPHRQVEPALAQLYESGYAGESCGLNSHEQ
jgi:hypothetical protein